MHSYAGTPESTHGAVTDEVLRNDAETLNRLACDLTADLELQTLVQRVCDAGTSLTHAQFGAFFNNTNFEDGDCYLLYALSGASREAFETFGMPGKTKLFGPTFDGAGPVRIHDVLKDPRYGKHAPHRGMPEGHLPVRSYLAVPVVSRSGEVLGGLFFGHPEVGIFDARAERMAVGVAAQAAVAIDNAQLLKRAREENNARQRSEAALRESETRYRSLIQALPVAMYTTDAKGVITLYNEAAAKLWGRHPEVGRDLWCGSFGILNPDGSELPLDDCPMAQSLRTGQPVRDKEVTVIRPDGSRRRVLPHPQPIHDAEGKLVGAINMLVDLTSLHEARQAREDVERRLGSLVSIMPAGMYTCDAKGRITYFNKRAAELWGKEPRLGESITEFKKSLQHFTPGGRQLRPEDIPVWQAMREGRSYRDVELIIERPDGTRIDVLVNVDLLRDEAGRIIGSINVFQDNTRRKIAERALAESENRFSRFMQYLPGLAWIKDAQGRYVYANDAAEKAFQTPREMLYGRRDDEVFPAEIAAQFRANDEQALSSGLGVQAVESLEHEDGVTHHSLVNKFPIPGPDGEDLLVGGMAIDITDRTRAEEALRESEQRFRLMADAAPVLIWVSDERKRGIYFNEGWLNFTGRSLDEELGDGWLENVHPDDLERTAATCKQAFERCEPFRMEFRMRRADGAYRWLLDHAVPRFSANGRLIGYIGSCIDVTDQKHSESELRDSEERLRLALEAGRMGTWEWSLDSGRIVWSPGIEKIHGRATGSFGGTFEDFQKDIHPDDLTRVRETISRAVETGDKLDMEYRIVLEDGTERWVEGRGKLLSDVAGNQSRMTGVCSDITERKLAQASLEQRFDQLQAIYRLSATAGLAASAQEISEAALDGLLTGMRADRAAVLLFDDDGVMRFKSWRGLSQAYRDAVEGHAPWKVTDVDAEPIPVQDVQHDEALAPFRTTFEREGIRALAFIPVKSANRVLGKFMVYYDAPRVFKEEELQLCRTLAGHVAFAVERQEAENALRASEERYRAVVEGQSEMVCRFHLDGTILFVNGAYSRMRGTTPEALVGENFWAFVDEADRRPIEDQLNELTPESPEVRIENQFETIDGMRWTLWTNRALAFDADGRPTAFQSAGIDITDRKRAEAALKAKESELELVAGTTPLILTRCSRDLRYRFVNRSAAALIGRSPDEIVGRTLADILGDEAFATIKPHIDEVLSGKPVEFEAQVRYPGAGLRWVRANYVPDHDESGEVNGWVASIVDITARKEAEERLRRSEQELSDFFESASIGLHWVGPDGIIQRANQAELDMLGYTREEYVGRHIAEFHVDQDIIEDILERLIAGETICEYPSRLRCKDGSIRDVLINSSVLFENGEFIHTRCFTLDITGRKQAEAALRESEEQFRRAIEDAPIPVIMQAEDGEVLQISRAWTHLTGYALEDALLFQEWVPSAYGADVKGLQEAVDTLFDQETGLQNVEFEVHTRDGARRQWLISASSPGTLRDGRRFVVCMAQDITERKRIEEALRESESRFRDMADYAPVLIFVNGPNGCEFVNREYLHFIGRPFNDVRGMKWLEYIHPDDREACVNAYQEAYEECRPFEIKHRYLRSDGEYRWLQSSGVPRFTRHGEMLGYVGCSIDNTDQAKARQSLERQSALLEEAVKQRTAELQESNQRLRLAERMASLGTLSAGLGHDIGNILIPVRVRLEALAGADISDDMHEHIDVIRQSTEYLQRLSSGLRLLAVDPNRAPPNESTLVSEWWIDAEPMFNNALPRGVALKSILPSEDCWIAVSRAALTQIVFNLVQNAGEATREVAGGEVSVSINATKSHVRIRVADNGRGMSEDVKRHCMEPFFTTKARAFSTGLGLSLIHRMVQDAKGAIDVESEPGKGSAFTITLSRVHMDEVDKPTSGGAPRLAVVHISDARLQAFACAELRTLKYDVVLGPDRLHEGELVVIDCPPADIKLREDAGVIVLNGNGNGHEHGDAGDGHETGNGKGSTLRSDAGHVVTTEARPKAIRTAIAELAQRYLRARSPEQEIAGRSQQR